MSKFKSFEDFEQKVMKTLLEKNTQTNQLLRQQYENAQIVSREFSGVGFFTNFKVPENVLRIAEPGVIIYDNVMCDMNDIKNFGGFVLFIEGGAIKCLEGYSFDHKWPNEIKNYKIYQAKD